MSNQLAQSTQWTQTTMPTATLERLLRLLFDDPTAASERVTR